MKEQATKVTGGCLCGSVRYEAEVFLGDAHYCHCRMCQRSTGAPAAIGVFVKSGTLRFSKEQPKFYRSSPLAERGFCPHCGSQLLYRPVSSELAAHTDLSVGSLDHPENVVPIRHGGVESQQP